MTEVKAKHSVFILIYVTAFISALGGGIMLPVLPLFFLGLGISYGFLGVISAVPSVTRLIMQIPFGKISDKIGKKVLIVIGFFMTAGVAPMYLLFGDPNLFLFLRGAEGVAAALCAGPLIVALLSEITVADVQGKVMGRYQGSTFVGLALGPLIGGYVADVFGIPSNFYLWGLLLAVTGFLFLFLQEPKRRGAVVTKVTGDVKKVNKPPLVESGFLPVFIGGAIIAAENGLGGSFLLTYLQPWAEEFGISKFYIGILIFGILGSMAVCGFLLGSLSDKYGRRKVIVGGSFLLAIGAFLYSVQQSYLHMLVSTILTGIGSAITSPAIPAYIGEITHPTRRGESFGIVYSISAGGTIAGAFVFGFIVDIVGLRDTTFVFFVVMLAMTFMSFLIKETKKANC
jgi:MFS family permease